MNSSPQFVSALGNIEIVLTLLAASSTRNFFEKENFVVEISIYAVKKRVREQKTINGIEFFCKPEIL